jgi:hypothetical protein
MCNARSNLISRKHFDLERFGFASNLRKSHENTSNQLNHWIESFVEVPKQ